MGKALIRVALSPISAAVGLIDKKAGAFVFSAIATAASFIPGVGPLISAGMHAANAVTGAYKIGPGRAGLSDLGRLSLTQVAAGPRKAVFGRTAMAVDLRYTEPSGADQRYVDAILHLASHKCHSVDKLYINDELAWTLAGGVQGIYAGYLTFQPILQAGPAAFHTVNSGAKWGAAQRMTGCCTAKLRIDRKDKSKDDRSPFAAGLPSNIRVEGRGMPVYDPRRDSTVPGGMGAHRAHDPATWQYQDGATILGENHALQALSWLLGWHIGGWVSVGLGLPADTLDMLTFATSANACDEAIALAAGGTQPRYWGGGLINDSDDLGMVMDQFAAACNGWWDDSGGKLGLHVAVNDLAGALVHITDDDMLGGLEWEPFPAEGGPFNVVRGKNPDPEPTALYQPTDYPEVRIESLDQIDRALPLDLGLVQDKRRAQRIAKQVLQRQQYRGRLTIRVGVRGWLLRKGQPVPVTLQTMDWAAKLFRVESWTPNLDGSVDLTLREENAAIYAWDRAEVAAVQPAEPVVYDPRNAPGGPPGPAGPAGAGLMLSGGGAFTWVDGALTPAGQTHVLELVRRDIGDDPAVWETFPADIELGGSGDVRTIAAAAMGAHRQVTIRATVGATWDATYVFRADRSTAEAGATVGAPPGTSVGTMPVEQAALGSDTDLIETFSTYSGRVAAERAWDLWTPGGATVDFPKYSVTPGGRALRVSGGSNQYLQATCKRFAPYDGAGIWCIEAEIEFPTAGTGLLYVGVQVLDKDGANVTGNGTYHYIAAGGEVIAAGRRIYRGYFGGYGASVRVAPDPADPSPVSAGGVFIAPLALIRHGPGTGESIIHRIRLRKVDNLVTADQIYGEIQAAQIGAEQIANNHLAQQLGGRIDLIDHPITGLVTRLGNAESAIIEEALTIDNLSARYTVKIDNNGHVSGFGLASESNDGTPSSAFIVRADKFAIVDPASTDPMTNTPAAASVPFSVMGGQTYIKTAAIQDASIGDAKIANLSAGKITAGTLATERLLLNGQTVSNVGGFLTVADAGINTQQLAANAAVSNAAYEGYGLFTCSSTSAAVVLSSQAAAVSLTNATDYPATVTLMIAVFCEQNGSSSDLMTVALRANGVVVSSWPVVTVSSGSSGTDLRNFQWTATIAPQSTVTYALFASSNDTTKIHRASMQAIMFKRV